MRFAGSLVVAALVVPAIAITALPDRARAGLDTMPDLSNGTAAAGAQVSVIAREPTQ